MLRYKTNIQKIITKNTSILINNMVIEDSVDESMSDYNIVKCYFDENNNIQIGDTITVEHFNGRDGGIYYADYKIVDVDKINKCFSFYFPKYLKEEISSIEIKDDMQLPYLYITFEDKHKFTYNMDKCHIYIRFYNDTFHYVKISGENLNNVQFISGVNDFQSEEDANFVYNGPTNNSPTYIRINYRYYYYELTLSNGSYYYKLINKPDNETIIDVDSIPIPTENSDKYIRLSYNERQYFILESDGIEYTELEYDYEYVDEYTIRWQYNSQSFMIDSLFDAIFYEEEYSFIGYDLDDTYPNAVELVSIPTNVYFSSPDIIKIPTIEDECISKFSYYEKQCNDGSIDRIECYVDNYLFSSFLNVMAKETLVNIDIPLGVSFDTNISLNNKINDKIVSKIANESINPIINMEKYVYNPVIYDVNVKNYTLATEINFNLHFRKRDDNWKVTQNALWNGINDSDNTSLRFYDNVIDIDSTNIDTTYPFFSFQGEDKYGYQSDLLKYAGFSNDDVKKRTNRLKNSFIRLSFYDSPNANSQNLLSYSNIYFDYENIYTKMASCKYKSPYCISQYGTEIGRNGGKIEYEPMMSLIEEKANNDIEKLRLSSQFTVKDRFHSIQSCEGFYLYLWPDNDKSGVETDVYMKIEFNHAGYGRTIPFFMPYNDDGSIKTFGRIMSDWNNGKGYSIKQFNKYSYIKLKYRYDKSNNRHIYYLDNELYGSSVSSLYNKDGVINLNLYEGKINIEKSK